MGLRRRSRLRPHATGPGALVALALGLAVPPAACSAEVVTGTQDAGGSRLDLGIGLAPDVPPDPVCTQMRTLPFAPRPADVLVVFDRSESMDLAFGDQTRYEVAARILGELLPVYDDKIRFGFQTFPARAEDDGACPPSFVTGCCTGPPAVAVSPGASPLILAALQAAAPVSGNTPTALALRLAGQHFAGLADGIVDRYVLLATDGSPSCTGDGKLPPPRPGGPAQGAACEEALAEVDQLVKANVRVIVLGIGSDVAAESHGAPSCLEALSRRGGVQRPDGGPALLLAGDREALEASLQQIFGAVGRPSCTVALEKEPADPTQVRVRFDGREIPRSRLDGWDYDPPGQARNLQLYGEPCRRLERFQVANLQIEFGCPPCGVERPCE